MFEGIRKAMLVSVGVASLSWEKVNSIIDELVSKGEISREQGKNLVDELASKAEDQGQVIDQRIRSEVVKLLNEMGVADTARVAQLESRVQFLEMKLAELESPEEVVTID